MPRRWQRTIGIAIAVLVIVIALGITFTIGWRPIVGPKTRSLGNRRFEATAARIERGKYLVNAVAGCLGCHTDADWSKPGAPPVGAKLGSGHVWSDQKMPWLVAPNITPDKETGAGTWSDDMFARAIREGIGHDGRTLFPLMPYPHYRQMSDEDLASIVVYLRTLPAVHNQLPTTHMPIPLRFFVKAMPEPLTQAIPQPDQSTPEKRGQYLVQMASCSECHSPQEKGQVLPGMDFAGGFILYEPSGPVASSNITPDPSGISYYDANLFVRVMREGKVGARQLHASMPWWTFGKMTDDDLKSIFAYLRTLRPVKHRVDNTEPPTPCKLCKAVHGLGDQN